MVGKANLPLSPPLVWQWFQDVMVCLRSVGSGGRVCCPRCVSPCQHKKSPCCSLYWYGIAIAMKELVVHGDQVLGAQERCAAIVDGCVEFLELHCDGVMID